MSGGDRTRNTLGASEEATPEQQYLAAQAVASHALNPEDCRELMQMLGLIEPDHQWVYSAHQYGMQGRKKIERETA